MNLQLAAQTLSPSAANAIEFSNIKMGIPEFHLSEETVKLTRHIHRLFDMLNSRNLAGTGYRQPLRPASKSIWELRLKSTSEYLKMESHHSCFQLTNEKHS